jgi:ribosomal protein L31E
MSKVNNEMWGRKKQIKKCPIKIKVTIDIKAKDKYHQTFYF